MRALRLRPASYAPYALAILPALLAGAACHPTPFPPAQGARRGAPNLLPSVRRVPADAPAGSRAPSFGEAVLAAANARAATASTCASGFADLEALRSAACSPTPAVAWDAFDETYAAAAQAAIAAFESGGPHRLTTDSCHALLTTCQQAGLRCPLDAKKIKSVLAAKCCENGVETARSLGAATENVAELTNALASIETWKDYVDLEQDPHLADEALSDVQDMLEAVKMHHALEYTTALTNASMRRTAALNGK